MCSAPIRGNHVRIIRIVKAAVTGGMLALLSVSVANPATGEERAASCIFRGASKAVCYDAKRMAQCQKTGLCLSPDRRR
jgi:hypothetical protein